MINKELIKLLSKEDQSLEVLIGSIDKLDPIKTTSITTVLKMITVDGKSFYIQIN